MFSICQSCRAEPSGPGYIVQKENESPKFYADYKDINIGDLHSPNTSMMKVNKSNWQSNIIAILNSKDKVFLDPDFPPSEASLGQFESIKIDKWKRISQIVQKPELYGPEIQPKQATSSNYRQAIGLSAVSACLAENPDRIKNIFGDQKANEKGAYKLMIRYKGQIQQVIVDDYVPVNQNGQPLFSKPVQSSIWMMLIQKARAKLCGSYKKMIEHSDNVKLGFQDLTFAPADVYKTSVTSKESLWDRIVEATTHHYPAMGYTSNSEKINWNGISLTTNNYYSIVDAAILVHKLGSQFKVVKLRNAFKSEEYKGEGSQTDTLFWDQVEGSQQKSRILSNIGSKQGIIYMLFSDYLKYFQSTYVNHVQTNKKYYSQQLKFDTQKIHGLLYKLQVHKEGNYSIMVDQNDMVVKKQSKDQGWSRTTILIIKDNSTKTISDYEYLDGVLKYNEQHPNIKILLSPGNYLIYVKLDPTIQHKNFPSKAHLIVYTSLPVVLKQSSQNEEPNLLKRVFSTHGRKFKRQFYNNDLMWSAWKLISQGGYAYLSFGNANQSKFKFVIKVDEETLLKQNFVMKKPFKGKGAQIIEVLPGQEQIILLRIKNSNVKEINFPPPIDIQIAPIL